MHIVPCVKFDLQSNLTVWEVADRVYRFVDPRYEPWLDTLDRDTVTGEPKIVRFQLVPTKKRQSKYNRTYEPVVTGRITARDSGSTVHLIMRIDKRSEWMLYLWVGSSVVCLWQAATNVMAEPDLTGLFPLVLMVLLGMTAPLAVYYNFRKESFALLAEIKKRI